MTPSSCSQLPNALIPISLTEPGIVTSLIRDLVNALSLISLRPCLKLISLILLFRKDPTPIIFTLSGKSTDVRLFCANACCPISSNVSGNTTDVRLFFANACVPIFSSVFGNSTDVRPLF